ncbi:hypothetical protein [Membranihabitans maritimus]|nr:hypothetical protein [Membranihabitans maritimus]
MMYMRLGFVRCFVLSALTNGRELPLEFLDLYDEIVAIKVRTL